MPPVGLEPTISAGERPQTYALDRAATGTGDVEFKLAKFLQLIGTIKRTIFRKVRTETILKIYDILIFIFAPCILDMKISLLKSN